MSKKELLQAARKTAMPKVVLIGRANVGKSTLFNRIIEQKKAIVSPISGTTRDINEAVGYWRGINFLLQDTGGIETIVSMRQIKKMAPKENEDFAVDILKRSQKALREADVIIFAVDNKAGVVTGDRDLAKNLVPYKKKIILVANKIDTMATQDDSAIFYKLGMGAPLAVSGLTGFGVGDLLDEVINSISKHHGARQALRFEEPLALSVAIVGKPNVGKSSLFNKLIGEEQVIVSHIAHTTREPHDTFLEYNGQLIRFVDTAGIRRKAKVEKGLEKGAVSKTISAAKKADVLLFVIDASEPLSMQDKHMAELIGSLDAGVIIVANKWDLITGKVTTTQNKVHDELMKNFPSLSWAPIVFVSAKTGQHVHKLIDFMIDIKKERAKKIPPADLQKYLSAITARHKPEAGKGILRPIILGFEQTDVNPPKFMLRVRPSDFISENYLRFMEKQLRHHFGFVGTKIWVSVKK